jgi:molybdopterin-synthase adenylyltransferase
VSDRFSRQADLVPRDKIADVRATVIGVGAIGRQVALQLAAIGVPQIQLIDFDTVELSNLTTQGYRIGQVGLSKVMALLVDLQNIGPDLKVLPVDERWRPSIETGGVIFCCVDSMTSRKAIWEGTHEKVDFWADGRMLGEVMRILTAVDRGGHDHYAETLFDESETEPGRCTARSTIYCASIAAALMVHQFTRWLRGLPCDKELALNLLASELVVS